MTIEAAVYVDGLNASYPEGSSDAKEGDNHLRLVKSVLKATFPYMTGPVLVAQTELNYLTGLSSNLVSQLAAKAPLSSPALAGTPTAPTAATSTNSTQLATTAFVQAQKDSPTFTGTPSAPTPATNSNSTRIATTEFVNSAIAAVQVGALDQSTMLYYGSF